jgi:hypothetical protein
MRVTSKILVIAIMVSIISCKNKEEVPDVEFSTRDTQYQEYTLNDRGWKSKLHKNTIDDITFVATDVPLKYYLLKNLGTKNQTQLDSVYEANKKEKIIEFCFEHVNQDDLLKSKYTTLNYQNSVKYMSFDIEKDFYIVDAKDTIKCSGVLFERNFKVAPYTKIMLYFSGINPANEDIQLIYNDKLFQKGTMKFKFQEKPIDIVL